MSTFYIDGEKYIYNYFEKDGNIYHFGVTINYEIILFDKDDMVSVFD